MAFDSVPWFVGGGAEHSPEVARLLAYASTGGAEGVVGVGDLKVAPLDVPGTAVRVLPGAALILNRATGGDQQTYMARNATETQVDIAATGSGSGRSDLIVAQVEDPYMPGESWQDPDDPAEGPYVFARVISNVPAGTTRLQDVSGYSGRSAVTLARIDLPASTGTVTADMITDLRQVAVPRAERILRTHALTDAETDELTTTSSTPYSGQEWPASASAAWGDLRVPEWASRARIVMTLSGVLCVDNTYGVSWVRLGEGTVGTQETAWDAAGAGTYRSVITVADDIAIPEAMRGTSVRAHAFARKRGGSGSITVDWGGSILLDVEFYEQAT